MYIVSRLTRIESLQDLMKKVNFRDILFLAQIVFLVGCPWDRYFIVYERQTC